MRWKFLTGILMVASCATLPDVDPRLEYAKAVRRLNLAPVYPPRQDFKVGNVFYLPTGKSPDAAGIYLGYLPGVYRYAQDFSKNSLPAYLDRGKVVTAGKDLPFSDPASVLPIAFPAIRLSAASAAAFGANTTESAGLMKFGRARVVNIEFENTRRFGLPDQVGVPRSAYEKDLAEILRQPDGACDRFYARVQTGEVTADISDLNWLRIVTGVIVSNGITFTSSYTRAGGGAVAVGPSKGSAPAVELNVTLPADATAAQVQEMLKGVSAQAGQIGASASGSSSSQVSFGKPLGGYLAIAYSSQDISPEEYRDICSGHNGRFGPPTSAGGSGRYELSLNGAGKKLLSVTDRSSGEVFKCAAKVKGGSAYDCTAGPPKPRPGDLSTLANPIAQSMTVELE